MVIKGLCQTKNVESNCLFQLDATINLEICMSKRWDQTYMNVIKVTWYLIYFIILTSYFGHLIVIKLRPQIGFPLQYLGETSKFPFCDHKQTTKDDKRR